MGLDQYIIRKRNGENIEQIDFRKFPALHGFMQEHCTEPIYDTHYDIFVKGNVTYDVLDGLVDLCIDILSNKVSPEYMPIAFGPFFGSTTYDHYFFEDVSNCLESVQEFLSSHQDGDEYEYDSWW